ncbi:hypothetical protein [Nocardioides donggukensis]|uniref:Uncharacterized protein n=1 Tax=Nocardioides donggukensis TaxID=2774019 RepID=A0A927K7M9_9ACTN|nr:hypothetical protein [Nocardioides donggukensis]MBD8870503.1 hypothetical protein [Nocardioides donggukensis]
MLHAADTGKDEVLAPPGAVARVVQVEPGDLGRAFRRSFRGLVALMPGEGSTPLAVFDPRHWVPHAETLEGKDLRIASGIEPLAQALGLTVEAASPDEAGAVRRAGRRGVTRPRPRVAGQTEDALLVLAVVVTFLGMPLADSWLSLPFTLLGFMLATPIVLRFHARRRAFHRLVTTPPEAEGRQVVTSGLTREWAGLAQAQLQIGHDYIVLHARGQEVWTPGPALGGADRCVIDGDQHLVFLDASDRTLCRVDARVFDHDQVRAGCTRAGLAFETTPLAAGAPAVPHAALERVVDHARLSEVESGSTTMVTPPMALGATAILLAGSLLALQLTLVALVPAALALALLGTVLHAWRLLAGWQSGDRARRLPTATIDEGTP